jgi:uncharacterized membrane protein YfcA
MPALLGSVGMDAHRAVGTNLLVGFFLGIAGFVGHAVRLEVDWGSAGGLRHGDRARSLLGARLTGRFSVSTVRRSVGAALLTVSAAIGVAALF